MCGICSAAALKEDCGVEGAGSIAVDLAEIENTIPGDTTTTEVITVGGSRSETLEVAGDTDWFAISLTDGEAIQIELYGDDHDAGNGLGALADPYVRIYDSNGNLIASNDDGGSGRNSSLTFVADSTETYYIEVDSYRSGFAGDYTLDVTATTPPPPSSPLDAIRGNRNLDDSDTLLVYFAEAGDVYNFQGDTYVATGMTSYEITQYFQVFTDVEKFADIDFEITTDRNAADLELATSTLPSSPSGTLLGFFNFPSFSGQGSFGVLNDSFTGYSDQAGGSLDTGGFMYGVAVHELGHGLGLGHPHDTGIGSDVMDGVSGSGDTGDYNLNQAVYTAMSYVEGSDIAGVAASNANTGHGATFGALDIAVLQEYYGANTTWASGDDTYDLFDNNNTGSGAGYYTIWDTNGTDVIQYTGSKDATIDLREATLEYEFGGGGFISHVDGVIGGFTIANGVTIENATGGSGDDTFEGNDAANTLVGNAGNDVANGRGGADSILGGNGNDTLDGGAGNDTIDGGANNDTVTGGDGADELNGSAGNDRIVGNNGNDLLRGGDGSDTMEAGNDNDTMWGGNSRDFMNGANGDDRIGGGGGSDDLRGSTGNDFITGDGGWDTLRGGGGDDTLSGGGGKDSLWGWTGNDVYIGGAGDDTFVLSDGQNVVTDFDATSDGERVRVSTSNAITNATDLFNNHVFVQGSDVLIDDLNGMTLLLENVSLADLDAQDFIF